MENYLRLLTFLKGHRRRFALASFMLLFASLFEGVQLSFMLPVFDRILTNKQIIVPNKIPDFLRHLVDMINSTDVKLLLWVVPLVFLAVFVIKQVVSFLADYLMNDIAQAVMRDVRSRLFERIQTLSLDYFSRKRTGELISRITSDVGAIENAISYAVTDFIRQPLLIIMFLSIAFTFNFRGTLFVFIIFPLIGIPMAFLTKKMRKIAKNQQEKMADINSHLLETISGARILKAFCTEKYEIERFRQQNHGYYRLRMKGLFNLMLVSPITEIAGAICAIFIFIYFANQVMGSVLSAGVFGFFFAAILQIIRPIKKLAGVQAILQQALAANERIYEVLDTKPTVVEKQSAMEAEEFRHQISFSQVSFAYDPQGPKVLEGIDFSIKKGELVAIVGPTGSGKSTMVNLIPRFYDATLGRVLFDGNDVQELSFKSLRSQIGIVTQEAILFNDTVRNNIVYGTFDATDEQVNQAATMAYAKGFIDKMPKGFETMVGDRGFRLSGGEKQRLTIARAILKNPPILILDEATSALDSESEKYVQQAVDELMKERTVIAIAHRLSTIMRADKIVVLEGGRMVGIGKHDDLLFSCPLYRRLYETQFQT